MDTPTDTLAKLYPVSIKGVVVIDDRIVLLRNSRKEWELPGGKLDPGEQPEACCKREIAEELGLDVRVGPIVDCWVYTITPAVDVLIVSYGCVVEAGAAIRLSDEHCEFGLFMPDKLAGLDLPEGYRRSIRRWLANPRPALIRDGLR
ncbi:MAG TPA: NUDIX hydrolase [Alphaproteobacteria bacterium]|nr:NUDIX hydrolase [Alphaproteobacteria bacterium]